MKVDLGFRVPDLIPIVISFIGELAITYPIQALKNGWKTIPFLFGKVSYQTFTRQYTDIASWSPAFSMGRRFTQ